MTMVSPFLCVPECIWDSGVRHELLLIVHHDPFLPQSGVMSRRNSHLGCEPMSSSHPYLSPLRELECCVFTIFGEHDALKSDKPTSPKVTPLLSGMPTFDANRCRHVTLTCPPLGS